MLQLNGALRLEIFDWYFLGLVFLKIPAFTFLRFRKSYKSSYQLLTHLNIFDISSKNLHPVFTLNLFLPILLYFC